MPALRRRIVACPLLMKILVTGASGFVGNAIVERLAHHSTDLIRAAVRDANRMLSPPTHVDVCLVGDLNANTCWQSALEHIEVVIHCAARVHVMTENHTSPLDAFRQVNVEGTLNLARQALAAGVKRFIFLSSIKVNGEQTAPGVPFHADMQPTPSDPYGISKLEAEQALLALAHGSTMQVVIIRPVLVYGPGVKANFHNMMHWIDKGIPLPLGGITNNRRSLVALDNLVDLVAVCMNHPAAAGEVFLVSDGEDLSTAELLKRVAQAMGKRTWLVPLSARWLIMAATVLGRPGIAQRLCGSLQVDISKNQRLLGWQPLVHVDAALSKTARAYRRTD